MSQPFEKVNLQKKDCIICLRKLSLPQSVKIIETCRSMYALVRLVIIVSNKGLATALHRAISPIDVDSSLVKHIRPNLGEPGIQIYWS